MEMRNLGRRRPCTARKLRSKEIGLMIGAGAGREEGQRLRIRRPGNAVFLAAVAALPCRERVSLPRIRYRGDVDLAAAFGRVGDPGQPRAIRGNGYLVNMPDLAEGTEDRRDVSW